MPQRLPRHIRIHVIQQVVLRTGGGDGKDVEVLQLGGELDLLSEPPGADLAGDFRGQDLDHDLAMSEDPVARNRPLIPPRANSRSSRYASPKAAWTRSCKSDDTDGSW